MSHQHTTELLRIQRWLTPLLAAVFCLVVGYWLGQIDKVAPKQDVNLSRIETNLQQQLLAIKALKEETYTHMDVLSRHVGDIESAIIRLDALGQRLVDSTGLDEGEFKFSEKSPVGGPQILDATHLNLTDLIQDLNRLSQKIDDRELQLSVIERFMLTHSGAEQTDPAGWPAEGAWISSPYGKRTDPFSGKKGFHKGIDLAAPSGSAIYAMAAGIVNWSGKRKGFGIMVEIAHGDGLVSRYAHCKATKVKAGDRVTKGQLIALVGSTGRSTGPHLHVEILRDNKHINPMAYLKKQFDKG